MLTAQLADDIKTAMKEKNSEKLLALRSLHADIKNVAIKNGRKEPIDDDVIAAAQKAIKQRIDSAEQFKNAGRMELVVVEETQANIYKSYLPVQLSEEEIRSAVVSHISSTGASTKKDMGRVMKELGISLKGQADMKLVSSIVGSILT